MKSRAAILCLFSLIFSISIFSQEKPREKDTPFKRLEILNVLQRPLKIIYKGQNLPLSPDIKKIQALSGESAVAFTKDRVYLTNDGGASWRIILSGLDNGIIGDVYFLDKSIGYAFIADGGSGKVGILATQDSGASWQAREISLRGDDLLEADFENARIAFHDANNGSLALPLPSSLNFKRDGVYLTNDGGASWNFSSSSARPKSDADALEVSLPNFGLPKDERPSEVSSKDNADWILSSRGECIGFKSGCYQESKVYRNSGGDLREVTPAEIKELTNAKRDSARSEAQAAAFLPPNGATRISLARGFDKCTAAPISQMQTWWNNSPFYDVNIYIGGSARGCSQPQLNAAWVNSANAQGWGLIPTWVGPQSPCSVCTTCVKHSSDAVLAETEGRTQADLATNVAIGLGMAAGSIVYYDMERYDDLSGTGACSTPTKAFLKGWTDRMKQLNWKSGVYGSPTNANNDWINLPPASQMDVVWMARWNNVMSVWGIAPLSDNFWTNHQRIHQWLGPRDETWGGVVFNIDNNISDAPVVGAQPLKNRKADFDGDGKSDISLFRPSDNIWHILYSANNGYYGFGFGIAGDILAPGDYDGDGKTDFGVFRPSNGTWYTFSRQILTSKPFGSPGDIPVPADYDGDGRTDFAVFRPSSGNWFIANSFDSRGTSVTTLQFGASGDKPVPADYDGDGKADPAVYRASGGAWYLQQSTAGFFGMQFGIAEDLPVADDYDGDGKADIAVWRPSNGTWYQMRSNLGFTGVQFGISSDLPSQGDYDGDGKADVAVYRNGAWFALQSQGGFNYTQFGIAADRSIESAYNPQN